MEFYFLTTFINFLQSFSLLFIGIISIIFIFYFFKRMVDIFRKKDNDEPISKDIKNVSIVTLIFLTCVIFLSSLNVVRINNQSNSISQYNEPIQSREFVQNESERERLLEKRVDNLEDLHQSNRDRIDHFNSLRNNQ